MKNHLLKKYTQAVVSGVLKETEIRAIKKHLSYIDYGREKLTALDVIEHDNRDVMLSLIREYKPKVTAEQAAKGLSWLSSKAYTPNGKLRKTNPFNSDELNVLKHGAYFELVDFEEYSNGFRYDYYPVYRLYDSYGNYFDYVAAAWQSGIEIQIMNTHYEPLPKMNTGALYL